MSDLSLYPHQIKGVEYLKAQPRHALLWDEQRVGKTPQVIVASGEMGIKRALIVTTVAGVGVWKHQWKQWDRWNRTPAIIPWSQMSKGGLLLSPRGKCELLVLDEGHYAKSFGAERTRAVYGLLHGSRLVQDRALLPHAERVWHLTGTPMPHDPGDLFPVLIGLYPDILKAHGSFPDVTTFDKFRDRYCVVVNKRVGQRLIKVVVRGRNLDELAKRIGHLYLRRLQRDVGIKPAFWDTLPVEISFAQRDRMNRAIDIDHINRVIRNHSLADLEPLLAPVRRITGVFKSTAVADYAREYLDDNPREKLVLFFWHREVGDRLAEKLGDYDPVRIDGSVTGLERTIRLEYFHKNPGSRVFLGNIAACGEAIDLSAAAEAWFVESTFTPAQMAQAGARVTNLNQRRQCLVRVASLSDTIDEVIQDRLVALSRSIAHSLGETYAENFAAH